MPNPAIQMQGHIAKKHLRPRASGRNAGNHEVLQFEKTSNNLPLLHSYIKAEGILSRSNASFYFADRPYHDFCPVVPDFLRDCRHHQSASCTKEKSAEDRGAVTATASASAHPGATAGRAAASRFSKRTANHRRPQLNHVGGLECSSPENRRQYRVSARGRQRARGGPHGTRTGSRGTCHPAQRIPV